MNNTPRLKITFSQQDESIDSNEFHNAPTVAPVKDSSEQRLKEAIADRFQEIPEICNRKAAKGVVDSSQKFWCCSITQAILDLQ
jgi:hypothetical protein